jgi:hypothetical protein
MKAVSGIKGQYSEGGSETAESSTGETSLSYFERNPSNGRMRMKKIPQLQLHADCLYLPSFDS